MKKHLPIAGDTVLACLVASAQPAQFLPGHLAVLRAGDGVLNLHLKQSPIFIDEFDPARFNDSPSLTVRIPTNGPETLFLSVRQLNNCDAGNAIRIPAGVTNCLAVP
jgi:hypothetical protein